MKLYVSKSPYHRIFGSDNLKTTAPYHKYCKNGEKLQEGEYSVLKKLMVMYFVEKLKSMLFESPIFSSERF